MNLKQLTASEFQTFVQQVPDASFLQTVEMSKLLEKRHYQTEFLGLKINGQLQVVALVHSVKMFGGLHMEVNGGPVSHSTDYLATFYQHLKQYAKQRGALQLVVKPNDTYQQFDSFGQPTSDANTTIITTLTQQGFVHEGLKTGYGDNADWIYVKDLTDVTTETLVSTFGKNGKASVKKTAEFNVKVRQLTKEELPLFKAVTSETAQRQGFVDKPLEYYQYFFDAFQNNVEFMVASLNSDDYKAYLTMRQTTLENEIAPLELEASTQNLSYTKNNQLKILKKQLDALLVRQSDADKLIEKYGHGDITLAASLFVYTPQEVVYLFSGSYTELNKFDGAAMLQKYAMEQTIKRQIKRYNFLGIAGTFDGSDGVLRFKQGFNGYVLRKAGVFKYYPNPLKNKVIHIIKKIMRR